MGYTTIGSKRRGIAASTRYFVPLDENLEIWQFTVTNERQTPAAMSVFSAIEFCLWDAQDDATNFQRNFSIGEVEIEDGVIYHKTEYRERRDHFAWFACSAELAGFDTQREAFPRPHARMGPAGGRGARRIRQLRGARMGAHRLAPRAAGSAAGRNTADPFCFGLSRERRKTKSSIRRIRRWSTRKPSSR